MLALALGVLLGLSLSLAGRVRAERGPANTGAAAGANTGANAGAMTGAGAGPATGTRGALMAPLPWADAQLLAEVMQRVRENYVDPVDDHVLLQNAIRGMVEGLDEHSTFLSPDEFDEMKVSTTGSYAGIGVEVAPGKDGVSIVRRMPGSPAEKAGIMNGDVIVRIDDQAVDPANLDQAIAKMRGAEGSLLRLSVRREGSPALLEFAVRRSQVQLRSVAAELLAPGYGYLRITSFTETTATELEQNVDRLEHAAPGRLKGFVIDLRNNPGGVMDAAVQIADDFLDRGTIVSAEGRTAEAKFRMEAMPGDISGGAQLVVLVNGGSASASEILAAALHDNARATLIGRRTYGKGSVQTIMPLAGNQALKITTSRYFTPSGASINGVGIAPDELLDGPEQPPAQMDETEGGAGASLAQRDAQVARALQALLGHPGALATRSNGQARAQ
jgi:carboxyl-terminal processing protease